MTVLNCLLLAATIPPDFCTLFIYSPQQESEFLTTSTMEPLIEEVQEQESLVDAGKYPRSMGEDNHIFFSLNVLILIHDITTIMDKKMFSPKTVEGNE